MAAVSLQPAGATDRWRYSPLALQTAGTQIERVYYDPSSTHTQAPYYLLGLYDADGLTNGGNLPVLLEMTCLTGMFQPNTRCTLKFSMSIHFASRFPVRYTSGLTFFVTEFLI